MDHVAAILAKEVRVEADQWLMEENPDAAIALIGKFLDKEQ